MNEPEVKSTVDELEAESEAQSQPEEDKLCLVCGDISSGKHYGAVTCEGCKGFFRRIICHNNENSYQCVNTDLPDQCAITNDNTRRKCCKSCRFKKCLAIGMKAELCVKVEATQGRPRNGTDLEIGSSEPLFESEEEMNSLKKEVIEAFEQTITFKPLADQSFSTGDTSLQTMYYSLNQIRINLAAKVRTFVSNVELIRQLDISVQSQLVSHSITELMVLMFVYNFERFRNLIINENLYFGDQELDRMFRSVLAIINSLTAELRQSPVNGHDSLLALIPALNLLVIIESHRFEPSEEPTDKLQVQMTKEQILMAFGFMDQTKGAKISQILYYLRAINAIFIRNNKLFAI